MKTCTLCGAVKLLSEFYANKLTADQLTHRCKDCVKAKVKEWQEKNPDKVRTYKRKWAHENPQKHKGDREKHRLRARRSYRKNPETTAKAVRLRRARKLGVEAVPYTADSILLLWGSDCHICGTPIDLAAPRKMGVPGWERGLHLDHVIPLVDKGPDTPANVKPAHGRCNVDKG